MSPVAITTAHYRCLAFHGTASFRRVRVTAQASPAPDRGKPLACGICHVPCLLPVLPVHQRRSALFPLFWSAGFPSFTGEGKTHQTI